MFGRHNFFDFRRRLTNIWLCRLRGVFSTKRPKYLGKSAYNIPTHMNLLWNWIYFILLKCIPPLLKRNSRQFEWNWGQFKTTPRQTRDHLTQLKRISRQFKTTWVELETISRHLRTALELGAIQDNSRGTQENLRKLKRNSRQSQDFKRNRTQDNLRGTQDNSRQLKRNSRQLETTQEELKTILPRDVLWNIPLAWR